MGREPLNLQDLRDGTRGSPWRRIEVVDETGSTNADLLARAAAGEDVDGAVLIAEHQTQGRGRGGRGWATAPRAQIALSVGVGASDVPVNGWGWLPLATGVAVVDAVRGVTGVETGLKWPNDVLAEGGKLAGILAEVAAPTPLIVVGVGLNVTLSPEEVDEPGLTSLARLGVANPDRTALARRLLQELGRRVNGWRANGGADVGLMADYRALSLTVGSPVRAFLPGEREIVGTATAVDEQGRLLIEPSRQPGGDTIAVSAGDVVHLRSTP
jgi:BirA family biotin operon repressor/biotin-[acetyl-CoA-carboxylase] ligase